MEKIKFGSGKEMFIRAFVCITLSVILHRVFDITFLNWEFWLIGFLTICLYWSIFKQIK